MASSGFQFKAFYVQHDQCAMKVGTDSIILGSWLDASHVTCCLDIGTGSGLLALMLAQKTASVVSECQINHPQLAKTHEIQETQMVIAPSEPIQITAIEPEPSAFFQAMRNFEQSPWRQRLTGVQADLHRFMNLADKALGKTQRFDLIVSNHPYFPAHRPNQRDRNLVLMSERRQLARQSSHLSLKTLLQSVSELLSDTGRFYCVLPAASQNELEQVVQAVSLVITHRLDILTTPKKGVKRQCWCVQKKRAASLEGYDANAQIEQLLLHQETGEYSNAFKTLCADFYLHF